MTPSVKRVNCTIVTTQLSVLQQLSKPMQIICFEDHHAHLVATEFFANIFDHGCIAVSIWKGVDDIGIDLQSLDLESKKCSYQNNCGDDDPTIFYD